MNCKISNNKHLTLSDREFIEYGLNKDMTLKSIALVLSKDPTTISKEIKLHRVKDTYHKGSFNNNRNFCIHRFKCKKKNVCGKVRPCYKNCASCSKCNQVCMDFVLEKCTRLNRAPFVCNGCSLALNKCSVPNKYHYNAKVSDREYREKLVSCREGLNITRNELDYLDSVIKPLIANGQSPYQIAENHPELNISSRTIYKYIDKGVLSTINLDLRRKVKYKPRKSYEKTISNREVFIGRTYQDFLNVKDLMHVVEMDTVCSTRDSKKRILTFFFREEKLFLAYLIKNGTTSEVKRIFDRLEKRLGTHEFLHFFECILTDRGFEFSKPEILETGIKGIERSNIYYCDPMRSGQKGGIEQSHTLLRNVLPKPTSFETLTQWDLNLIVNHINSTPRKILDGKTPYKIV